jgi:hypothetical protein
MQEQGCEAITARAMQEQGCEAIAARAMQEQDGAARPSEIKEEARARRSQLPRFSSAPGDIRWGGLPRPAPAQRQRTDGLPDCRIAERSALAVADGLLLFPAPFCALCVIFASSAFVPALVPYPPPPRNPASD